MKKRWIILLLLALIAIIPAFHFSKASAETEVKISFDYQRQSTIASNQIALWVEDEKGHAVRTLLATSFTAGRRGYRNREMSLENWVAAAQPDRMDEATLDAISSATPSTDHLEYIWDLTDDQGKPVPAGDYLIRLEGTLYWESSVLYTAHFHTEKTSAGELKMDIERSQPDNHENETMIQNVTMSFSKPTSSLPTEPGYRAFAGYLRGAGRTEKGYDGDAFIQSEAADLIFRDLYYYATYSLARQDDPAIDAYWQSLGLKKRIYDKDDNARMWSVFVPTAARFADTDKFPLVFCLHGNNNNILLTETYGFAKLGGEKGFITVIPWAQNEDIIIEEIPRILEILRSEKYPIDESRIYVTGFSKGGLATQTVALAYSDVFAAAAPGGFSPIGVSESASPIRSGSLNWSFQPEAFEQAKTMPMIIFGGSCDSMPIDTSAVKEWIALAGANAPEDILLSQSDLPVEQFTGLRYQTPEQMEIREYDGQNYYIGSYYNADGFCTFRAVSVEGAPHWLMPSEAKVVWEFLSQFARDTETGELIYLQ